MKRLTTFSCNDSPKVIIGILKVTLWPLHSGNNPYHGPRLLIEPSIHYDKADGRADGASSYNNICEKLHFMEVFITQFSYCLFYYFSLNSEHTELLICVLNVG